MGEETDLINFSHRMLIFSKNNHQRILNESYSASLDLKYSTAAKGDIAREEDKSDAKNEFPSKICIDIAMQFFSEM